MMRTESIIRTSPAQVPSPDPDDLLIDLQHAEGGIVVLHVTGEIDMRTAPELRRRVTEAGGTAAGLVIDLENVGFLASAGLSILVELARNVPTTGLKWGVVATGRAVLRPLEAVGLLPIVPVYATTEAALAVVRK
jgi:anti-anti-sigma factor